MSIKGIYAVWFWTCPICGVTCGSEHETRDAAEDCLGDHLADHANNDPEGT